MLMAGTSLLLLPMKAGLDPTSQDAPTAGQEDPTMVKTTSTTDELDPDHHLDNTDDMTIKVPDNSSL